MKFKFEKWNSSCVFTSPAKTACSVDLLKADEELNQSYVDKIRLVAHYKILVIIKCVVIAKSTFGHFFTEVLSVAKQKSRKNDGKRAVSVSAMRNVCKYDTKYSFFLVAESTCAIFSAGFLAGASRL